jgi:hypothetical protein
MVVRDTLGNINRHDVNYHPLKECKNVGSNAGHYLKPIGDASNAAGRKKGF